MSGLRHHYKLPPLTSNALELPQIRCVKDRQGRYLLASDHVIACTGFTKESELIGRKDTECSWAEHAPQIRQRDDAARKLGQYTSHAWRPTVAGWSYGVVHLTPFADGLMLLEGVDATAVSPHRRWLDQLDHSCRCLSLGAEFDGDCLRADEIKLLHYFLRGYTQLQIADRMEIKQSWVKNRLTRIKEQFLVYAHDSSAASDQPAATLTTALHDLGLRDFILDNSDWFRI